MVYEDTRTYIALFRAADINIVERAQHFNPFFSWVVVAFTYFTIGVKGGKVWKYLFYVATLGFIATYLSMLSTLAQNLNYYSKQFMLLKYGEGFLWTLTEWGYTYINFVKVKSCIKALRKTYWQIIMFVILGYSLVIRFFLSKFDSEFMYLSEEEKKELQDKYDANKDRCHGLIFLPLGIVSLVFIYFIIKEFIEETDKNAKSVISSLLHSTLTRMTFVSLIFIGLASVVYIPKSRYFWYLIRMLLWRLKGDLGIIFLVDMLLLRIDLDHNQIIAQEEKIDQYNIEKSISGKPPVDNDYTNYSNHLNGINMKVNTMNFDDLNLSMNDPVSQHEEKPSFVPNGLIQDKSTTEYYNKLEQSKQSKRANKKRSNSVRMTNSSNSYEIIKDVQNNYYTNSNYVNNHNRYSEINDYSKNDYTRNYSNNSQHSQINIIHKSSKSPLPINSPASSPGVTYVTSASINKSSPGGTYVPSASINKTSPYSNTSDYLYNSVMHVKPSPSNSSSSASDLYFIKSSQDTSKDELIYTRPLKSPSRKNPGNIILDSTLQ